MLSRSQRPLLRRVVVHRIEARANSRPLATFSSQSTDIFFPSRPDGVNIRHLSTKADVDEKTSESEEKESLQDTIRRMRQKDGKSDDDYSNDQFNVVFRKARETWASFSEEVGKAWNELLKSGERKDINKKLVHPEDTAEGEAPYTGPVDIMVIDENEHLSAFERMQRRLAEAPIISGEFIWGPGLFEMLAQTNIASSNFR